jgi:hypothetical protein
MRIVLFVNDSYFAYLLARWVIKNFHDQIVAVVLSTKIKRSPSRILYIYRRTHWRYFVYRLTVDFASRLNTLLRKESVTALAKRHNLKIISTANVASCEELRLLLPAGLGIAFNYDQILSGKLLAAFTHGVLNLHCSRLPKDRGISPLLWAFARGDSSIWSTIYRMDEGLDSGPIFHQFPIAVEPGDTACSLYKRVASHGGRELAAVVQRIQDGLEPTKPQPEDLEAIQWSWPDQDHRRMMANSKRRFMKLLDFWGMLGTNADMGQDHPIKPSVDAQASESAMEMPEAMPSEPSIEEQPTKIDSMDGQAMGEKHQIV